jgi:glutamyl-tRNA(Gln) amidotransferase subunit E
MGAYDPAVIFEFGKMRTIKYYSSDMSSCLVEADEEPPHEVDEYSLETSLIISLALNSNICDELHVMRKTVIDGSNTSGFQRTILIATGGHLDVNGRRVGVQSICLEEDAAKLIFDNGKVREYGLDRLGVALVEIALRPVTCKPEEIAVIALSLGRLLRASKRVARGLGSVRQDVNVSIGDGAVVEVKGIQRLEDLVKVTRYEMVRQHGLVRIAQMLGSRKSSQQPIGDRIEDVTEILAKSTSNVVSKILVDTKGIFKAVRAVGFRGIIGFEPYPDIRLGKQISEMVRFYGLSGIFHSDELPGYGIKDEEVQEIKNKLQMNAEDAFVVVGGPRDKVDFAVESIVYRLRAALVGVPPETRAATLDGKTVYSRPKPGASRMYPETDIPSIPVNQMVLANLCGQVPEPMDQILSSLVEKYSLNRKLAEQIFDSEYFNLFGEIATSMTVIKPTFIASKLTEDLLNLERQGLDRNLLTNKAIVEIFCRLDHGTIAKESVALIFEKMMKSEANTVEEAITQLGITSATDLELDTTIDLIVKENLPTIYEKGFGSIGTLMGKCMAKLRGKADGQKINSILKAKLGLFLESNSTRTGR